MALQIVEAYRHHFLDYIETQAGASVALAIRSGPQPSDCAQANSGNLIVTINLPADWMNAASAGQKTKAGTWSASATGTFTAGHFRLYSSQATMDGTTCVMQGSVGQGTGDLSLDNTAVNSGQTVTISTFTLTSGNQ